MSKGDNRRPNDTKMFERGFDRTFNRDAKGRTRQDVRDRLRILESHAAYARGKQQHWARVLHEYNGDISALLEQLVKR